MKRLLLLLIVVGGLILGTDMDLKLKPYLFLPYPLTIYISSAPISDHLLL